MGTITRRDQIELHIRRSDGAQFEQFVKSVYAITQPGFLPIRPYGNVGDGGNDGYVRASGRYYQVHAPRNAQDSIARVVKKAERDFRKLLRNWDRISKVEEYCFVLNEYGGSVLPVEKA